MVGYDVSGIRCSQQSAVAAAHGGGWLDDRPAGGGGCSDLADASPGKEPGHIFVGHAAARSDLPDRRIDDCLDPRPNQPATTGPAFRGLPTGPDRVPDHGASSRVADVASTWRVDRCSGFLQRMDWCVVGRTSPSGSGSASCAAAAGYHRSDSPARAGPVVCQRAGGATHLRSCPPGADRYCQRHGGPTRTWSRIEALPGWARSKHRSDVGMD